MRLLTLNHDGDLSLIERTGEAIPQYAILSHTWGPNEEEVTFQDLMTGAKKDTPGYRKIKFCVDQANRDGLRYSWVDTCCIDKTNSVELSETINSMFAFYRNASRCYVYLKDVSASEADVNNSESRMKWETAFQSSRWFTRGWTLQELVASPSVEFFSTEGICLGDKTSLEQQVHQITGIALQALRGGPLDQFDYYERMSWAATRETTREEDAAYSLLGIFEVSMPVIYGEGRKRAMARLYNVYKEISEPPPPQLDDKAVHWIVPFDRNPDFTGRNPELVDLKRRIFKSDGSTKTIAIAGLGGIGKTQLVLELAYQIKDMHRSCSIIWIPATNMESLHQAYVAVAKQLGIPGLENSDTNVKKLVQEYLSNDGAGKWILIYDNADDLRMWVDDTEAEQQSSGLMDYVPKSRQGCVVFTTRNNKVATELAGKHVVKIHELNDSNALDLLQTSLIDKSLVKNSLEDAKLLLEQLTHLPLAIVQAAAYINKNEIVFAEYLSLLAEQETEVVEVLSENFRDKWRYHDIKNPVAITWLVSFRQIHQQDPLAAEYLTFMACIDSRDIPQSLLPPGISRKKEMEAIGTLTAYSFITRRPADLALDLHRLVHLATRNWLRREGLLAQSTERALAHLQNVFPEDNHENRAIWRLYLPHARYIIESDGVNKDGKGILALTWKYAKCLSQDGRWVEAEAAFRQILEAEIKELGQEQPDTLATTSRLASTLWNQGRWDEAEQLWLQVVETRKKKLGDDHPDTLTSIHNLALTYREKGRLDDAERLQNQVVQTSKTVLGLEHPDTLTYMNQLASTYSYQGQENKAEKLKLQVLEILKKQLGDDHPDTLISMNNLAVTLWKRGRWMEAEQLELQVVESYKKKLGNDHPDTLISMSNLAATLWKQGRWDEAEQLELQVVETRKKKLGDDHPDTLTSMNNLAITWKALSRDMEALELMDDCVRRRRRRLGANNPNFLSSQTILTKWQAEQVGKNGSTGPDVVSGPV
jgi:tetratricopeptide (TPR) repeat protein